MQTSTSVFSADFVYLLHAPSPGERHSPYRGAMARGNANKSAATLPHDKPAEAPLTQGDLPDQDGSEDPGASLEFTRDVASGSRTVVQPNKVSSDPRKQE